LLAAVGGKNASLGEMIRTLQPQGISVPDGFALTASAFRLHLERAGLDQSIYSELDALDVRDVQALSKLGRSIRLRVASAPLPPELESELAAAYRELSAHYGDDETDVAVRSSATAEDLPSASFAGQQETYLNVHGKAALNDAVRNCMASLFTDRAIAYRSERGFVHRDVALSVGVQKMVRSDSASAGVIFTLDPETGFRDLIVITGSWGLGESVVQGRVSPDEFRVHKPTLAEGYESIIRRERGDKALELVYASGGTGRVVERRVSQGRRMQLILEDDEVLTLARWAVSIEKHYSEHHGRPTPMDIEWAKDGQSGKLFIVQARPETVHAQAGPPKFSMYRIRGKGKVLAVGKSVGAKAASGRLRVIHSPEELPSFQTGEVLVAEMTDPDWEPVLKRAAAVVTDHGGRTCHAAIVSRELGIPCVVGTGDASSKLVTGQEVTVSCAEGDEGKVYEGRVAFDCEEIDLAKLEMPSVPIMLNVGNPELAFSLGQLPVAGVGLMRMEFVISSWIGVHPMALLHPERVTDRASLAEIRKRAAAYPSPDEFFVDRLSSGIAQIAAGFYPRPVIVRMSDFKTNEYASLIGGAAFEPAEHNPMIGFRGASRYYDERYREGFALECRALRRVRDAMGLDNVKLMIPFCRTLQEASKVLAELEKNGLERGVNGLEVYVMAEIPNNIILASEFAELFDGFSIGSNDLTQLALGVDRDSEQLAQLFDEQDEGVKRLIAMLIEKAHAKGRKVGICGQAPSDHPEFAHFLAKLGIDSISVTSDALPKVIAALK
ncbi:MAG TPA: phosphoenolpyruvate synthase, partial [Polyangiaceae bacterium]|nr:phosphoenolpyruvate synthase [Polyangiaceae bacterium]